MSQTHTVRGTATTNTRIGDTVSVRYHGTEVFRLERQPDGSKIITLRTNGWETATTKTRMNQALNENNLPWSVYQKSRKWYVWNRQTDQVLEFEDGMTLKA